MGVLIFIIILIFLAYFFYFENNSIVISKYFFDLKIKREIRIIHLSDLHGKEFGKKNNRLKNKIFKEKPDLIFATGDMIDSNLNNMEETIEFLGDLNKRVKTIYISGNNEKRSSKAECIFKSLKKKGIVVLKNEIITLEVKGEKINILGLFESSKDKELSNLKKIHGTYEYKDAFKLFNRLESLKGIRIVLSHYPELFNREYSKYNFHFMFAGHAHGGQFRIPFLKRGIFAPGQGFFPKYTEGVHGDKNKLIISRGLGNSARVTRLFNRPEIVEVIIR